MSSPFDKGLQVAIDVPDLEDQTETLDLLAKSVSVLKDTIKSIAEILADDRASSFESLRDAADNLVVLHDALNIATVRARERINALKS